MKKYLVILIALFSFSCKKVLDDTLPYANDKLVLFAIVSPASKLTITVERTYPPTGKIIFNDEYLTSVQGELYEDGKEVGKFTRLAGTQFGVNYIPKEGKMYFVKMRAKDFEEASSTPVSIPEKPIINSVVFNEKYVSPTNPEVESKKLSVSLSDTKDKKNYYSMELISRSKDDKITINDYRYLDKLKDIQDNCINSVLLEWLFNDICFENQTKIFNFSVSKQGYEQPSGKVVDATVMRLKVKNISEGYYKYLTTKVYKLDFLQVFSPIKPQFTNVKNGYGAVVSMNETSFDLLNK